MRATSAPTARERKGPVGRHPRTSSARVFAALAGALRASRRAGADARARDRSDRGSSLIATPAGIARAQLSARLSKAARGSAEMPAVGDWVAVLTGDDLDAPLIEAVLERASAITRGDPGRASDIQVLAANIDTVFVVHPIADPPNLRRIERELSLAWDSGATPVVVLTKADLSVDPEAARSAVEASRSAWTFSSRTPCRARAPSCSWRTSQVIAPPFWSGLRAQGSPRSSMGFSASRDRRRAGARRGRTGAPHDGRSRADPDAPRWRTHRHSGTSGAGPDRNRRGYRHGLP